MESELFWLIRKYKRRLTADEDVRALAKEVAEYVQRKIDEATKK